VNGDFKGFCGQKRLLFEPLYGWSLIISFLLVFEELLECVFCGKEG
jgi:hypothetical protein